MPKPKEEKVSPKSVLLLLAFLAALIYGIINEDSSKNIVTENKGEMIEK